MVFSLLNAHHLRGLPRLSHTYRPLATRFIHLGANLKAPWFITRNFSASAAAYQSSASFPGTRIPQVRAFGFRELGIDENIAERLEKVFPDVQRPTLAQTEYIPAILEGKDVVVHDETGTGK